MNNTISIIIILARGIERYEQVFNLKDAPLICKQLGGLHWRCI